MVMEIMKIKKNKMSENNGLLSNILFPKWDYLPKICMYYHKILLNRGLLFPADQKWREFQRVKQYPKDQDYNAFVIWHYHVCLYLLLPVISGRSMYGNKAGYLETLKDFSIYKKLYTSALHGS